MNQGKLEVVKQKMTRVNIILGISELKCTRMGKFNSDDPTFTSVGKKPLEEMEQPSQLTKESKMQYLGSISETTEGPLFPRQTIQYHSNPSLCPYQ